MNVASALGTCMYCWDGGTDDKFISVYSTAKPW